MSSEIASNTTHDDVFAWVCFFAGISPIMRLALHMRASNDIKWPFRKQLQPNLYQECVGGCPIIHRCLIIQHMALRLVSWFSSLKRILSSVLYA